MHLILKSEKPLVRTLGQQISVSGIKSRSWQLLPKLCMLLVDMMKQALILTGRSRHGKIELARQMENLLDGPFVHVDCTEIRCKTDIMGPKAPYVGHAGGSFLNNHLAATEGKRNIVFLDEFEVGSPGLLT